MVGSSKKGIDPESVQDFLDLDSILSKLRGIDLGKLAQEREEEKTPNEKLVEALRSNKRIKRGLTSKTPFRKKQHWKVKAAKRKKYFMEVVAPKRSRATADLLTTGEGWYTYLVESWRKHSTEYRLTREEFLDHIYPEFRGGLPIFCRYNQRKPVALENIYVLDQSTRRVMFDGAEYHLVCLGYCLHPTEQ